ncbi:MAG: zinc-binding dehydrogenase [Candidatus Bipolaricaulota bacterium]|nr:zinc-binding dehydrogenase [Candidatus Bipolaricaulota bacterium]MDW8126949.1 zinc-binding dehydrogenase [Candidatus Bipolaricaulota bacterium]
MKALVYTASIPRYLLAKTLGKHTPLELLPLRLREIPAPEPPAGWERGKVLLSGICGSDLALLFGKSSPRLAPFFSFPAVLGHEIVADVGGVRAAINPLLACRERGLPPCWACAKGEDALCQNVAEGTLPPGMLGYHRDLPGGWGERIVVHPARVHVLPPEVPTERGLLAEPLAVVLRGLRLALPSKDLPVLILGAGAIGLLTVASLKLLGHKGAIHVVARHRLQADMAQDLGATAVHASPWEAVKIFGGKSYRPPLGPAAWRGGFPFVIDAAGSETSVDQALWSAQEGGTVLLLGAPGEIRLDLSPLWFRGIQVLGTYTYSDQDFRNAVGLLGEAKGLEKLLTHTFPLADYRSAFRTVLARRGIKVAFRP